MRVCIGITTKNRAGILRKAVESALNMNYTNKEVFVFDDGSTDDTSKIKDHFPEVKWERSENSLGLLEARNRMMTQTNADYFVTLDDDAWFINGDEINVAVEQMEKDLQIAAIAFDVLQNNTKRIKPYERTKPVLSNVFIGCGNILRLSAVKEAGYYVPFPGKYGHEEKDLCIRFINLGYKIYFLPGVHVWHEYTKVERNYFNQYKSFVMNDLIFSFRRVPLIFLLPVLGNNILRKLRSKGEDKEAVQEGVKDFFKLLPSQMKYVKRVSAKNYIIYRRISKAYLAYLQNNS